MANQLYHHGIEGQRWGVRNGPPYPLTTEARKKTKEQAISEGSATDILEYANEMTNKELIDALNRVQWMAKLEDISSKKENPDVLRRIDRIMDKVGDVKDWVQNGLTLYLLIDKIAGIATGRETAKTKK